MPHTITFENIDDVPEELRYDGLKAGEDGKVQVTVVPKIKVDEFRDNNINVSRERDELKRTAEQYKQLVGEDIDAFKTQLDELKAIKQQVDDGKLQVNEDVEKVINERVAAMKTAYEEQLEDERKKGKKHLDRASELDNRIRRNHIERMITDAALDPESGVLTSSINEFVRDAIEVWEFPEDGGDPVPKNAKGMTIYGEDGTSPMTPKEWIASLKKDKRHRFKQSGGGGAHGSDKPGNVAGMSREEFLKLPARQRLELANKAARTGGK